MGEQSTLSVDLILNTYTGPGSGKIMWTKNVTLPLVLKSTFNKCEFKKEFVESY